MKSTSILLFLALWVLLPACSDSEESRNMENYEDALKYRFMEDGIGITFQERANQFLHSDLVSVDQDVSILERFNRGGKRGHTIMVTGDLPCFAQMRSYPQNTLSPDLFKLGDGRIRIRYDGISFFLDSLKDVITFFRPGITTYQTGIPDAEELTVELTVFHAGEWGVAAKLEISNTGRETEHIEVDFLYGGLRKCGRTHNAPYFSYNNTEEEGNLVEFFEGKAIISDTSVQDMVGVMTIPETEPHLLNGSVVFSREFELSKSEKDSFYLITSYSTERSTLISLLDGKDPEEMLKENASYYDALLSDAVISTPNRLIDGGFRTALVNLDNVFTDSAWLEGVHWWNAYFTNLFQISASISLDQRDRAKNALLFYNSSQTGPAPAMQPNKMPAKGTEDDGLDYYVYALMQYIESTGDTLFLREVWPDVMQAFRRIMKQKDPDGDYLLFWQFGCNIFLYQADLLGMPGKSASPSIMTSGMMERFSNHALTLGEKADAAWLSETSSEIKKALMACLWNSEEGCFYNHIDLQQIPHMAHYYTDHIFSTLYSSLDPMTNWQSLNYLRKTLVEDNFEGKPSLMRVGNLQGKLFGNDNVMPTQMAESARAFYKTGDKELATSFLESVARAGTIYTGAPGNFPERMSDEGRGESNYLFGNPIGSFIYAVVNGLFGLEVEELGRTMHWQPGFPDHWDHASLHLPYVDVQYKMRSRGGQNEAFYTAKYPYERGLRFSVFLPPGKVHKVTCNGKEISYEIQPGLNRIELTLKAEPSLAHEIKLTFSSTTAGETEAITVVGGTSNSLQLSQPILAVEDPQSIFEETDISNVNLEFTTRQKTGEYTVFIKLQDPNYFVPVKVTIVPPLEVSCDTVYYDVLNKTLSVDLEMLNYTGEQEWTATASVSEFHQSVALDSDTEDSVNFVFKDFPLPLRSIENIGFTFEDMNGKLLELNKRVVVTGSDELSLQTILEQRMLRLRPIDISPLFNSNSYLHMFPWGRDEQDFNLGFVANGEPLQTRYGSFEFSPSVNSMLMIELGRSDAGTRKTVPTQYTSTVEIPVGFHITELDLLYLSEVESRNTGTRVGEITLIYANNDTTYIPLVVGQNMDFFRCYTARNAFPVFFNDNLDQITSYDAGKLYNKCCNKHLNLLPILCDNEKALISVRIGIEAADAQFGLIGVNCLE